MDFAEHVPRYSRGCQTGLKQELLSRNKIRCVSCGSSLSSKRPIPSPLKIGPRSPPKKAAAMAASRTFEPDSNTHGHDNTMLDASDAAEEIASDHDQQMDSVSDDEEDQLLNGSVAHFNHHQDSIFCISAHPLQPCIIVTGSGDDSVFVFSSRPLLFPLSPSNPTPNQSLDPIAQLRGHTDSVNAIAFTLPHGDFLCTAGLDGRLRVHATPSSSSLTDPGYNFLAESREVNEINWLAPCPNPRYPNTLALGASDGSVWVYTINPSRDSSPPLQLLQAYYLHTQSCTAGAWTPDGKMLASVSEDGSLYVWDPLGEAVAAGVTSKSSSQAVIGLTTEDQRFAFKGGLYSIAVSPSSAFVVVGGAGGLIHAVSLPRLHTPLIPAGHTTEPQGGGVTKRKAESGKPDVTGRKGTGQAGLVLATLEVQSDSIETLSFSVPPLTLLAAGSVDGGIVIFDSAHRFAVRRHIRDAHEGNAVVKVEFAPGNGDAGESLLTSCGMDGVVRRWDTRGGVAASGQGMVAEWRGHRGEGEGGGVLGFVQTSEQIITAGDDGVAVVFETRS